MTNIVRRTYIISDLHLGGVYPDGKVPNDRGFRICTHAAEVAGFVDALTELPVGAPPIELIVNGDLVDFLAERDGVGDGWVAFTYDQQAARAKLRAIIDRDKAVFDALARFLAKGHRLVILLGNHDIELAMPTVRHELKIALGVTTASDYTLIRDGEAYIVGDALVEHGNRYDAFNIVDYERLNRHCQFLSRVQPSPADVFDAPPGSHMVAEVINPIKMQYKFIDLLKPENGAVVPLLLTFEPGYRSVLGKVALIAAKRRAAMKAETGSESQAMSTRTVRAERLGGFDSDGLLASDISSGGGGSRAETESEALDALLTEEMGGEAGAVTGAVDRAVGNEAFASDISSTSDFIDRTVGMARLLISSSSAGHDTRIDALYSAFRALQNDQTFNEGVEGAGEYIEAAKALATNGVKHVVFGHTHMPKKIALPSGGYYLNSGTWADVMRVPKPVLAADKAAALPKLADFVGRLLKDDFSEFALFHPTYVRIDVLANGETEPELVRYDPANPL